MRVMSSNLHLVGAMKETAWILSRSRLCLLDMQIYLMDPLMCVTKMRAALRFFGARLSTMKVVSMERITCTLILTAVQALTITVITDFPFVV